MSEQTCRSGTIGTGRAVAVIALAAPRSAVPPPPPLPPLVAQLLAARLDMPQSRARRRAAPERGCSAYAARLERQPDDSRVLTERLA